MNKKNKERFIAIVASLLIFEVGTSTVLYQKYRVNTVMADKSPSASLAIFQRIYEKILDVKSNSTKALLPRTFSIPKPFLIPDIVQGYTMRRGKTDIYYRGSTVAPNALFKFRATVNSDGSRYVGLATTTEGAPTIHIFGDSFIFGEGVNDEQTFSYLLQTKLSRKYQVKLWAAPGYSLTNALLKVMSEPRLFKKNDIVMLFYGDYFDVRHVQAPSRLKAYGNPNGEFIAKEQMTVPRVKFDDGKIELTYIPIFCVYSNGYCDEPDPSQSYMKNVTLEIVRNIQRNLESKIVFSFFWRGQVPGENRGSSCNAKYDGSLLQKIEELGIEVNRIDPCTFDYFITDDISGFDSHPGPFWHFEMFKRLERYFEVEERE